ncbi:glycoside hydrolase N-terminal domain-containing protein [Pelagicoccus sp. SDUM812005]|uniref:glycosyl hydrolase family 95 catalytic domain-containing protein n=1 Tax=Pelagicoccus sp. SDUM812005 TaxID=3041257 RepID=UPI00280CAC5B|nr:glycoside hydrolase N-terminal domain-containing protein [Pelagicoccus sp. SDUM812005]MDQ8181583.1 glycoside hydrolase N-terminal domain-containing protein [Pelagicoccus sp. SDUM812005]
MRPALLKLASLALSSLLLVATTSGKPTLQIVSDKGAPSWDEGYPIGNGRIGLLTLGTYPQDTLYFNENSIWAKQEVNFPADAAESMAQIRALAEAGKFKEADALYTRKLLQPAWRPASYEYAGHATLTHRGVDQPEAIRNTLDLETGLSRSVAIYGDGVITREAIALRQRDVIAIRLSTTRPDGLNFELALLHPNGNVSASQNKLVLAAQAATGGTRFETHLQLLSKNGKLQKTDTNALRLTGGNEAIILYTTATDYNFSNPEQPLTNWQKKAGQWLSQAEDATWATLLAEGQSEMKPYMDRFSIDLGESDPEVAQLTTAERIQRYATGKADPDYEELLFQFGRYCLIASNRTSGLPNNLQGIWSEGLVAPWSGDYHLNINLQMNYWPSETTGLSEFHQPFLDFVTAMQPGGKRLAKALGYEGFASGHAVNAWMNTWFSGGKPLWGASLMNGAWITAHMMEHYRFTADKEFLKNQAWPAISDNARFILSWLKRDPVSGKWITGPGNSPENEFIYTVDGKEIKAAVSTGTTHDLMLAWESLSDLVEAAAELGIENDLVAQAKTVLPDLAEGKIGEDGRLLEWSLPHKEPNPGHRHVSHAYGFFPSRQYNIIENPVQVDAVRKSLDYRLANGGGRTGWSRAWLINIEACLLRPEAAYANIRTMLSKLINPNLFDMHPPFQIDGNFGYTSGVVTMLLQSQIQLDSGERVLWLLPALPAAWPTGEVKGLKARGGATIDLKWSPEKITAHIAGERWERFQVRYRDQSISLPSHATQVEITRLGEDETPLIRIVD